ncbi:MAG: hypothetical protein WCW77_00545 [Patescibacteria group bacterium]|jgi:hypothetical protein
MYDDCLSSESEYKKQQEAVKNRIMSAAKKSDSQVLKSRAKVMEAKTDKMIKENCRLAEMLFMESIEMYENGDMTFKEMIDDLTKALKAVESKFETSEKKEKK